jgi:hypothetical protein
VEFYRPLIDALFDENYVPREDVRKYVNSTNQYRNEKPFTFVLELLSHLFFYNEDRRFVGLHYDGYYEVDERRQRMNLLERTPSGNHAVRHSYSALPRRALRKLQQELVWRYSQFRA